MIFEIDKAEELLGYEFKDKLLLRQCFTHASYAHEHEQNDNEVLEFFGDSVLQFVVTEYLFKERYANEGKLTELRKDLVAKEPLLRIVKKMGLHELLLLGKGATRGNLDEKLYSSLYEAVVAGIYIDGGMDCARRFIKDTLIKDYNEREKSKPKKKTADDKSKLQEFVQKRAMGSITYVLLDRSGPDHSPFFRSAVLLNGGRLAEGTGKSKKASEAEAAGRALEKLIDRDGKR